MKKASVYRLTWQSKTPWQVPGYYTVIKTEANTYYHLLLETKNRLNGKEFNMDIVHMDLDPKSVRIDRLIWHPGTPYDPPGYYMIVTFQGNVLHLFLAHGDKPVEDKDE